MQKKSEAEKNSKQENKADNDYILVGKIAGVYGIKGWLKIHSHTRPIENIAEYKIWHLHTDEGLEEKQLRDWRMHGKSLTASLKELTDRDQAKTLQGKDIFIHRSQLPELEEGEYFWQDLIGLRVLNQQQKELGIVKEIIETGSNDVLAIEGKTRILIPWVRDIYVTEINLDSGCIIVDWPEEAET